MKKIVLLLVIGMMSLSLVACGDGEDSDDILKQVGNGNEDSISQGVAQSVKAWLYALKNDFDYEELFDTTVIGENDAQRIKDILNQELKWTVFYLTEDIIMFDCRSVDNQRLGAVALISQDGSWKCTWNTKMNAFCEKQICNNCNGTGVLSDARKCAICKGEGIFIYTGSDVDLGLGEDNQIATEITQEFVKKVIEDFVSNGLNTFNLSLGEVHKPSAAVWLSNGTGTVYSSDENVVTISEYGKVTAVGKGIAHIVIVSMTGMSQVYQYIVE